MARFRRRRRGHRADAACLARADNTLGGSTLARGTTHGVELATLAGKTSLSTGQTEDKPANLHLAFTAKSREQVDAFQRAALEARGDDNGAFNLRQLDGANYYATFVIRPDGHDIEAVCHKPED